MPEDNKTTVITVERRRKVSPVERRRNRQSVIVIKELFQAEQDPTIKEALKAAFMALGGKGSQLFPAARRTGELGMVNQTGEVAGNKAKDDPVKAAFTPAIQALIDSRPDLADKLLAIAQLSQPATVRASQMKAIIRDNPPAKAEPQTPPQ